VAAAAAVALAVVVRLHTIRICVDHFSGHVVT
jgi:hypothetical protein